MEDLRALNDKYNFLQKMAHAELERVKAYIEAHGDALKAKHSLKLCEAYYYSISSQFEKDFPLCAKAEKESGTNFFNVFCDDLRMIFDEDITEYFNGDIERFYNTFKYVVVPDTEDYFHDILDNHCDYMPLFRYDHDKNSLLLKHVDGGYSGAELNGYFNALCFIVFRLYDCVTADLERYVKAYELLNFYKNNQTRLFKEFLTDQETARRGTEAEAEKARGVIEKYGLTADELSTLANYLKKENQA